ncbi:MAG: ribosome-associated translation inhibitor RaiA [Actinomycetota bacterium]
MEIIIQTRHAELASDFREIAEEKLRSMERFSVVIDRIEVEITHEANPRQGKNSHKVVITSHGSGPLLRSEEVGFNDLAAFDSAVAAIELQIRRIHEKEKHHDRHTLRHMKVVIDD